MPMSHRISHHLLATSSFVALALASVAACDDPADEAALIAADQAAEAGAAPAPVEPAHGTRCDADDHLAPPPATVDQAELARGLGVTDLAAAIAPDGFPERGPLLSPSEMESFKPLAAPLPGPSEGLDQPDVPIYVGQYVQRAYYQASLRILRVCDANGTNCGSTDANDVRAALDATNALQYRSDGLLRFAVAPSTNFNELIQHDGLNNACKPVGNLASYTDNDPNNDGVSDQDDIDMLCPPISDNGYGESLGKYVDSWSGATAVYSRGGFKAVKWDGAKWVKVQHEGGFSSCEGHAVTLTNRFGGGTFVAHELGHYFCSPHTFYKQPKSLAAIVQLIKGYVDGGDAAPTEKTKILKALFDGDTKQTYEGEVANLAAFPINDTPPDPDTGPYEGYFGVDPNVDENAECWTSATSIQADVAFGAPWNQTQTYTLAPDRRNVMSYFKGCFGPYHYFSPNQITRAHAAATGHRASVVDSVLVGGWENTLDVTIPPRSNLGAGPLTWVSSYLKTTGIGSPTRVRVHVDIKHDTGGLNINLVTPNGLELPLQSYTANVGKIAGDVKTIFYINGAALPKDGLWQLKVSAQYSQLDAAVRKIDDWRIEFE